MTATQSQETAKGRDSVRGEPRQATRANVRPEAARLKPGEYRGRDGEILTRRRLHGADEFHVPEEVKQADWSYQWNTVSVYNQPAYGPQRDMWYNGWRPVRPGELDGYFDHYANGQNEIVHMGLRLECRPLQMTLDAKADEERAAAAQFGRHLQRADTDQPMPDGFEFDRSKTKFRRGDREEVPSDLKPRYRAQVAPADDE